jgi:hypothetical protein
MPDKKIRLEKYFAVHMLFISPVLVETLLKKVTEKKKKFG